MADQGKGWRIHRLMCDLSGLRRPWSGSLEALQQQRDSVRSGAAFQVAKLAEQTWPAAAQNVAASLGDITTSPSQDNPCNSKLVLPPGQWTYGQVKT